MTCRAAAAQLDAALGAWNAVGSRLQLDRAATGGATCPSSGFTGNGRIGLYWNDPCNEIGDGDPLTFGVGGGFFTPGFQKTINGVVFNKFLQGLAILNNTGPHLTTAACLQDAVTHVLGHAVGLGHSGDSGAVMSATLRSGCSSGSAGLASDDIEGLRSIYPAVPSGGSPPNPPTALTNSVALDTVTLCGRPRPPAALRTATSSTRAARPAPPTSPASSRTVPRHRRWSGPCRRGSTTCGSARGTHSASAGRHPRRP
ncbi:MAG: matrixin family metalloprotease [Vicinamibacterales bacterium]